jgi:hypothetical protein
LKQKLFTFAKIAISLGLIAYVFSKVHVQAVVASLAAANPWLILLALAFYVLAIGISGAKWNVLLRALDVQVPFREVLRYIFVGFFFNNVLPANIGGDVMRGYGMARTTDRTADTAVSVVVDRLIGLLAYVSTAAVMAIVVITLMGHTNLRWLFNLALVALVTMVAVTAVLFSRRLRRQVGQLLTRGPMTRVAPLYASISGALDAYRFRYRALLMAFFIALAGLMVTNIVNWLLFEAVGGGVPFVDVLLFNPLIALVLLVPISIGGHGVIQGAYPFFYALLGVPTEQAVAVSVLMSAIIIVGSLPGGILWLRLRGAKKDAQNVPSSQPG